MVGLILTGGKGTRLRPLTFTRAKQLIPIANKPNLFYVIEDMVDAGVRDIALVISPETGDEIRCACGDGSRWDARFTYIVQDEPKGLAHAVMTASDFLADRPFLMYLGDNLLSGGVSSLVKEFENGQADAMVLLTEVDNPGQFGVAALDDAGNVKYLVEKPKDPPSNMALVGVYLFGPCIHQANETLKPSGRGEYEITDAIQSLIDSGKSVIAHRTRGWWKDTGKPEDLLEANRQVLSEISRCVDGEVENSQIIGEVVIEPGARIINSELRGPVHIAAGAIVRDSYIGPYSSIGPDAVVESAEVEFSILMAAATVRNLDRRLDGGILGRGASVTGGDASLKNNTIQLVLGDRSSVAVR